MQKVVLQIHATLELDSDDFKSVDGMELDKLRNCVFEIRETVAPVSIVVGNRGIGGKVRFVTPTPYELKVARLKSLTDGSGVAIVYDYESLSCRVRRMQAWKLQLLAAACAEKVSPIAQLIGMKRTWLLVKECLDLMWALPLAEPNASEIVRLIELIESSPEWDCDGDNSYLPFEVGRALDKLHLALTSIISPQPHEKVEALISLMRDLADSWDASLARVGGLKQEPMLEENEITSQERLVSMISSTDDVSPKLILGVKSESQRIATLFRVCVPMYCFGFLSGE